jgi:hypothetical protein
MQIDKNWVNLTEEMIIDLIVSYSMSLGITEFKKVSIREIESSKILTRLYMDMIEISRTDPKSNSVTYNPHHSMVINFFRDRFTCGSNVIYPTFEVHLALVCRGDLITF